MNILIVGSGGREHAIGWKVYNSPQVHDLYFAPGNGGTSHLGKNLPIDVWDFDAMLKAVQANNIGLIVVGPEVPLESGIVDYFSSPAHTVPIFGPTKRAAQLESSKAYAKMIMRKYGVPTAHNESFESYDAAVKYVEGLASPPVVKADGLAAGKGVTVPATKEEALAAIKLAMVDGYFGDAGKRVVLEEHLQGKEASLFAITDGKTVLTTVSACDYKRVNDNDDGPNTGGMGCYSPPEFLDKAMLDRITETVLKPTIQGMEKEGRPYRGVLYAGLMVNGTDVKVIEFNCRFGDPEAQVILPRLQTDIVDIFVGVAERTLHKVTPNWHPKPCVGVVMASGGYPGAFKKGYPITGLQDVDPDVMVFHAGTKLKDGRLVTDGGRVLIVSALGKDMAEAREQAYSNVKRIKFQDAHYRTDIALRAI
ncbi:MAG: phosphoribosylamine--glycine ligase [Chloroflexi bacterium]|nr:phosphoribosylamine--glycine ligase [Chloroflexota bacterium]